MPTVADGRVTFPATPLSGRVALVPTAQGFEFTMTLDDRSGPPVYMFVLDTGTLTAAIAVDGHTVYLTDATGAVVSSISAPIAVDATGKEAPLGTVSTTLIGPASPPPGISMAPSEVLLKYMIDPVWLARGDVTYPVTIDPTICIAPGQTSPPSGCDSLGSSTGYFDTWITQALPNNYVTSTTRVRVGDDAEGSGYGHMRGFFYFPSIDLGDGAEVVDADLRLYQKANLGNGTQQVYFQQINAGWDSHVTWNNQPGTSGDRDTTPVTTPSGTGAQTFDVTTMVRDWYTRDRNVWRPNLGIKARLVTETNNEVQYANMDSSNPVNNRPRLIITYVKPKVWIDFETSVVGPDFVPTTMPASTQTNLRVTVKNNGSGFTFNNSGSDYYKFGYRWFDALGKPTAYHGNVALSAAITSGSTSAAFDIAVTPPATPGQYSLRLDLMHVVNSVELYASDWATPSKYLDRTKYNSNLSNSWFVGSSIVQRADFPVAVVGGGGTAAGETKTLTTADGSSLGINIWSRNLHYEGDTGLGFADLGGGLGVRYTYDSDERADCSGILKACGWLTNWDEGFRPGTAGAADYIYIDAAGNRYLVAANGNGQLTSGAPVGMERPRITLFDESWLTGWSTAPSVDTANNYPSNVSTEHSYYIAGSLTNGTSTTSIAKIDLDHYALVSFALKGSSSVTKGAIGFQITNESTGVAKWLAYTVGTDFTVPGADKKIALGGSSILNTWRETVRRDLRQDAVNQSLGSDDDSFAVTGLKFWGSGQTGNNYFDAVRFQGRSLTEYDDSEPAWTTNGSHGWTVSEHYSGSASIEVEAVSQASSPDCSGACMTNVDLNLQPFVTWVWKKTGGQTMAQAFHVKDTKTNATDTITYYVGPELADGTFTNQVHIGDTAPGVWTRVTRNLLDDARQLFGWFHDIDDETDPGVPGVGPIPDPVEVTGFQPIAYDGRYALFDLFQVVSLPSIGDDYSSIKGDDFVVTLPGGSQHYFNSDGLLTRLTNASGNTTYLDWTYTWSTSRTLGAIRAPANGLPLSSGNATRKLTLSGSTAIRFTEVLDGVTGRYAEFAHDGSNNLTSIVPARLSASCAGSGPSGCTKFAYSAGTSLLSTVTDPRDTGSNSIAYTITYTGSDPMTIANSATAADQLRIKTYSVSAGSYRRVRWQDANGTAGVGSTQYARYTDLNPNGAVVVEFRPLPCTDSSCTATTPSTPADKLVEYQTDGVNNYSSETHYRLTGNGGAVTSRRGSFAAAAVDNFSDPISGGLVAWTQNAAQYAASSAAGNVDLYRTDYTYNADGLPLTDATPFYNPSGSVASQRMVNIYDAADRVIERSDRGLIVNGDIEFGYVGWTRTGSTVAWDTTTSNSGDGSLKITGTGNASQTPQLVPGQTFAFQLAMKTTAGSGATYKIEYERASDLTYQNLLPATTDNGASWHMVAYDVTVPQDGTGKVKLSLYIGSASGTVYFDDAAILTTYQGATYLSNGLPDTQIDVYGHDTKFNYTATSNNPAIFPTSVVANYVSGQGSTPDQNVTSYATYDSWGRQLTTTDPDGVVSTTTYASNKTDVASTADGLGNTTQFTSYDAIGQNLSVSDALSRSSSTTYDVFGNPVDITGIDGVVTHNVYDGVGRLTDTYANWVNGGSGTSGVNNIRTTLTLDEYGQVTRQVNDVGVAGVTSDLTYDLMGNKTSTTVYTSGTSNPRTVTTYYGSAGLPLATRGPINPTASAAPSCPTGGVKCNALSTIDMNGRTQQVTDAYDIDSVVWQDFAGHTVRSVANYVSGGSSTSTQNVVSTSRFDPAGRVVAVTDPLGQTTSTTYDNLNRITKITRPDTTWVSTTYKASGRVDTDSRPTGTVGAEIWTKHLYDAAGRATKTLEHYDTGTTARLWLNSFEAGADGWSNAATTVFLANAATSATSSTADGNTGAKGLAVVTGTGSNAGASAALSATFKSGHTYRVRVWAKTTSGTVLQPYLGVDVSAGDYATLTPLTANGSWQAIDGTWTPSADRSASVRFAVRRNGTSNVTVYLDDVVIWDDSSAGVNPSGKDWNIPSETVYDAVSRVTASIMPPGDPATETPMVTLTTYDSADRVAGVRVAATPANQTGQPDLDLLTSYAYDAIGDQTDVTDSTGVITHYVYDRIGNTTTSTMNYVSGGSVTNSQNVSATFAYNARGELSASCEPKQVQASCNPSTPSTSAWRYTYDEAGHVLTATPPANGTGTAMSGMSYVYDTANGGARLTRSCVNPSGGSCSTSTRYVDNTYDALGRVTSVKTSSGVAGSGTEKLRTDTVYDAGSQVSSITYYESATQKDALTFTYDSLGRPLTIVRSGSTVTTNTYNPDSTVATRKDHSISTTASSFTYDWRGQQLTATSPTYTGSTTFGWRLDGLIASRVWPTGTNSATFGYDRSKRPTSLNETLSGNSQASFTQGYDRGGNVTSEGRTVSGISGVAGTGSQSFTYDALDRVTGSSLSGGPTQTYGYDANSNRTSWNDGTATTTYDYNDTDELTAQHKSGVDRNYTYDTYGNMTSSAVVLGGATSYTYNEANQVSAITPPIGSALTFTIDALGRRWTKKVGGTLTETYGYAGGSQSVLRIDYASSSASSAIDALGNRSATSTSGGAFGWQLPDLHGNVAAVVASAGSSVSDAFRYDAYGRTIGKTTSSLPTPWRYQGRLQLSTDDGSGNNADLYDFGARGYDPQLGVFTSFDSVQGGAQNPLTLNRFLYAAANPATLIDPSGHYFQWTSRVASNDDSYVRSPTYYSSYVAKQRRQRIERANAARARQRIESNDNRVTSTPAANWSTIRQAIKAAAAALPTIAQERGMDTKTLVDTVGSAAALYMADPSVDDFQKVGQAFDILANKAIFGGGCTHDGDAGCLSYRDEFRQSEFEAAYSAAEGRGDADVMGFLSMAGLSIIGAAHDSQAEDQRTLLAADAWSRMPQSGTIDPSRVGFAQNSVSGTFKNGNSIWDLGQQLKSGAVAPESVPPIRIFYRNGRMYSLDNRRLVAFQQAGIPVPYRMATAAEISKESWKMTTTNDGWSVRIDNGRQ